jgi:hypothetical protein
MLRKTATTIKIKVCFRFVLLYNGFATYMVRLVGECVRHALGV